MKKLLLSKVLFAFCFTAVAQQTVSPAGNHDEAGVLAVSWTLGQIVTETHSNGNIDLTQGLHQTGNPVVTSATQITEDGMIRIYPNPSTDWVRIENADKRFSSYEMLDIKGIRVMAGMLDSGSDLQIDQLSAGSYMLLLKENETGLTHYFNLIIN